MRDPLAAKFEKTLDPWQRSVRKFDFDPDFVKWIQKYLEKLQCNSELVMAKSWINGANYAGKRRDDCELQWEAYQESLKAPERPSLKPVVSNSVLPVGDTHDDDRRGLDCDSPAPLEPELPDEFKALEGESPQELQARRLRVLRAKISGMVGKK